MRNSYLVCYDIADDKRLAKVHKAMRGFGDHLQYSIFECQFTRSDLLQCRHRLDQIIDPLSRLIAEWLAPPKLS